VKVANVTVPSPLPHLLAAFTIMAYLPAPRRLLYGLERIVRIAQHYPDTKILIVGRSGADPGPPPNMHYLGHVPVNEGYRQATVLVQLCDHDGMANMGVEALALGRHCIWNYAIPGVIRVDDADAAIDAIRALKIAHEAGALEFNLTCSPKLY
jgi:hypothetical protein